MTRRRWIADQFDEEHAWLKGQNALHLARVLRARAGQEFDILCGGRLRAGTIVSVAEDLVEFALGEERKQAPERETILVAAIYKFDRLEWAIEKCTELGLTRMIPMVARRTDARLAAAAAKRVERWRRIAHEAAQQSRRIAEPRIEEPVKLQEALAVEAEARLLLNEEETGTRMRDALRGVTGAVAFAVGPEGGWTAEEVDGFVAAGWRSVTLGPSVLRAETAAMAAMAAAAAVLE
jgi:16S rRNA (uracil1498-N3)-methyltransferase